MVAPHRMVLYPFIRVDWLLLAFVAALGTLGITALGSATVSETVLARQLLYLYVGLAIVVVCSCVSWRAWKWLSVPAYVACVALLFAVELFGVEVNSARRWLDVGPLTLQPSELAKVFVPLALACFYGLFKRRRLWQHVAAAVIVAVPTVLVFGQPDLGTAVMVALTGLLVVFFAGLSWWVISAGALGAALAAPFIWSSVLKDYQRDRILSVINPYQDPLGSGYHTIQSSIAVGSGGMWGKGLGQGTQSQLGFLPEKHTDFIFAVYAEEFGFVGCALLLGLIALVFLRMLIMAGYARDEAAGYFAAAVAFAFLLQSLVNMGMVSGVLPVVGLPLPLVSYGGTSLLALALALGLVMSAAKHRAEPGWA